jgi:hypothetical protein
MAQHIQQAKFLKGQKKCPVGLLEASPHYSFSTPFPRSRLLHKLKPKRSRPNTRPQDSNPGYEWCSRLTRVVTPVMTSNDRKNGGGKGRNDRDCQIYKNGEREWGWGLQLPELLWPWLPRRQLAFRHLDIHVPQWQSLVYGYGCYRSSTEWSQIVLTPMSTMAGSINSK